MERRAAGADLALTRTAYAGDGGPRTTTGIRAMKTIRYLIIGTTLALATAAGSAGPNAMHRAACTADAIGAYFGGTPAGGTCAR